MIPEGWSYRELGNIFEFKNGANTEAANYGFGIKFVNVMEIFKNSILMCHDIRDSVNLPDKKINLYLLKKGDILFNRTSETFDEIAMSAVYLDSKPAIFGGFVIRARPVSSLLSPEFCVYCFSSSNIRKELIRRGQGAIRANIAQSDMKRVPILIPPLPEQKKIATILSTWDKAIETTEKLIENRRAQKKSLMQQLLTGKKRLPSFSGEWKKVNLGEVAKMNSGGTPKSTVKEFYDGDIPWASIADMTRYGKYISTTKRNITKLGLENSSARLCQKNTVLYAMYASIGECSISNCELCTSQAILCIKPKENLYYEYIYYFLSSLKEKIKLTGQQGTQANLNKKMVESLKLSLPTIIEQKKIASILSCADNEIEMLQSKLDFIKKEKKALMQQLLTGKCRVNV
jgi:type I restriction enzyme S subunit